VFPPSKLIIQDTNQGAPAPSVLLTQDNYQGFHFIARHNCVQKMHSIFHSFLTLFLRFIHTKISYARFFLLHISVLLHLSRLQVQFHFVIHATFYLFSGSWNTSGCVILESNNTYTLCQCNHLTNFAILMSRSNNTYQVNIVSPSCQFMWENFKTSWEGKSI